MLLKKFRRRRKFFAILLLAILAILVLRSLPDRNRNSDKRDTPQSARVAFWKKFLQRRGSETPKNTAPDEVPEEYESLYSLLDGKLTTFDEKISKNWNGSKHPVVFSAGLITANPNAGDLLLQPSTLETSTKYLDRLQGLGVKGVAVDINFPLLDPQFYDDQSKYEAYLNFYKTLFAEIEKRGMVAEVEVQPIFPDYSTLEVEPYYKSLTFDEYKQRVLEMLKIVSTELEPAYLTVANEPDTAAHNSGQPLQNLDNYIGAVQYWTDGLESSGATKNTKLGAGFGTWYKDYKTASTRLSKLPNLDFINIHVYPVDGDLLDRVLEIADIAKEDGKTVAIHESWLYKWKIGEKSSGGIAAAGEIYGRDIFEFWQSLDKKFIGVLVKAGHLKKMEYVSFFWSNYFFKYFTYEEGQEISEKQRMNKAMVEGAKAAVKGETTDTGRHYSELIK